MHEDKILSMGRLGSTYGYKGYIKVQSYTHKPESLFAYSPWLIRKGKGQWQEARVEEWQPHAKGYIAKLVGTDTKEDAAAFTGSEIGIRRSSLPPPSDDEVYLCDLEGCRVMGIGDVCLGTVSRIMDHGASPVMVVSPSDRTKGKEILIPFVKGPIVRSVNLEEGIIEVEWGEDY